MDCKKDHGGISFATYTGTEVDGLQSPWGPRLVFARAGVNRRRGGELRLRSPD